MQTTLYPSFVSM